MGLSRQLATGIGRVPPGPWQAKNQSTVPAGWVRRPGPVIWGPEVENVGLLVLNSGLLVGKSSWAARRVRVMGGDGRL